MKKICHYFSIFVLIISPLLSAQAYAQDEIDRHTELLVYLTEQVRFEYGYYANTSDDGSEFPQARQQEILQHIEHKFLKHDADEILQDDWNLLAHVSSIDIAKLFLFYGGHVLRTGAVSGVADQNGRYAKKPAKLNHDEIVEFIKTTEYADLLGYWNHDLPSNNAIALLKLYIALRGDIHLVKIALESSLYEYIDYYLYGETTPYVTIDKIHNADDIIPAGKLIGIEKHYYYRSPVTYWLEEFIAADYPASMLDTHKLHYPRFMKDASVAQVTEMLENPDAHKIPTNQNCPYKAEAMDCPLTPSINMRDAMGRTPLHIAGEQGNKAVFDTLIQIGADKTVKDYRGKLPKL